MKKTATYLVFLLLISISSSVCVCAQKKIIKGIISDKNEPNIRIPDVRIYLKSNPSVETRSNTKGEYTLAFDWNKIDTIVFKHAGYEQQHKVITEKTIKSYKNGTIPFDVLLSTITLTEFTLLHQKVDTVFGNPEVSVQDYIVLPNNNLLLLVYEKTFEKGAQLWLTNSQQEEISAHTIPFKSLYLYTDYAQNHYVVGEKQVCLIVNRNNSLFLKSVPTADFYNFHSRIIDSIADNYYYSDYHSLYPAVNFYCSHRKDSSQTLLKEVKDDFMMELYRAQYKYVSGRDKLWAYRKEQETGIDKEIWIGAQSFTQDLLYQPVYAPLFVVNDTVLIFDQYKSYLYKYTTNHRLVDSSFVNYYINPKGEKWEQPLVKDAATGAIYATYNRAGYTYLRKLDSKTGLLTTTTKLTNRFVSTIKIHNGYVYYIYRPYESQQKKFLYKEEVAAG